MIRRRRRPRANFMLENRWFILAVLFLARAAFLVALVALLIGLPPGIIMALPTQVLRTESVAAGMGVFYARYYPAMALLPGIAGWARDLTNDAAAPVLFAAGMMIVAAGCLTAFRAAKQARIHSRSSVER